ncbi:hypothetical protein CANMA_001361 [Candida margitis]|uniref:uncharacterized protein n=1 Tax=Candida margitis TaxID=1775924 RepID=UPI0022280314|nr:uncharacterized protein CANMA_001361 [Candida margitis]KAI5969698.1 hypothetical protein CANMA_001361 [Candida margitis]
MNRINNKMVKQTIHSDPTPLITLSPKIAPRSNLQFKVGPPFGTTIEVSPVFVKSSKLQLNPIIEARIDRGLDLDGDCWVGYKRNYFSLVSSFSFEGIKSSVSLCQEEGFSLATMGECHDIKRFAIRLVSRYVADNNETELVQHTAKRTVGVTPPIIYVIPGTLPSHSAIKQSANLKNREKLERTSQLFVTKYSQLKIEGEESILYGYTKKEAFVNVAKYERIQFTGSVGGHRRSEKNDVILQVQLLAELKEKDTFAVVAVTNTPPLTIRGRSPSSYPSDKSHMPVQKVHNVESFLNTPCHIPSPLSQGWCPFDQEKPVPYSDGFIIPRKTFDLNERLKEPYPSSRSSSTDFGYNDVTFFNTIDKEVYLDPLLRFLSVEPNIHNDSTSFSNDYFAYSEDNPDMIPLQHKPYETCVFPDLVFKE